jgi:riboflavin transporter FmnP
MTDHEKRLVNQKSMTLRITTLGMLAALSIALVFMMQVPIIPMAPYLKYDMADIPILIGTLFFGPVAGLILTVLVAFIQGITVSADGGPIGIIMHICATGTFVIVVGLLHKLWKNRTLIPIVFGILSMTLIMIPLNLILTPIYYKIPVSAVVDLLLPAIIPFNLIKAGVNGTVAFLVYQAIIRILPHLNKKR